MTKVTDVYSRILDYCKRKFTWEGFLLFATTVIIIILFVIGQPYLRRYQQMYQAIIRMIVIFFSIGFLVLYLHLQKSKNIPNLKYKMLMIYFAIVGFLVRLAYVSYTGYASRQYDIGRLDDFGTGNEHFDYILSFIINGFRMPGTNSWQYYHPPLFHFLSSLIVRIQLPGMNMNGVTKIQLEYAFENLQLFTLLFTSVFVYYFYKTLKIMKLPQIMTLMAFIIVSTHPILSQMAGRINNDMLMFTFMMASFYYAIKWLKEEYWQDALLAGITAGCAAMSKASGVIIALIIFVIFLYKFFTSKQWKNIKVYIQGFIFAIPFLILGMWHTVYMWNKYRQPLGFVPKAAPNLSRANLSWWDRFGINFSDLLSSPIRPFMTQHHGKNIFSYILVTSIFGHFDYWQIYYEHVVLIILNLILIIISLIGLVLIFKVKKMNINDKIPFVVLFVIQLGFYYYFNILHPASCTMDFRYMAIIIVSWAIFIAAVIQFLSERKDKRSFYIQYGVTTLVYGFAIVSIMFYLIVI